MHEIKLPAQWIVGAMQLSRRLNSASHTVLVGYGAAAM